MTRDLVSGFELDPSARRALEQLGDLDEVAAEGCLRVPLAPAEVVVGFRAAHRSHLVAAADHVAPAQRARLERWLDANPASDLGFKVGARPGDLQVYVRGDFEVDATARGFAAVDVPCEPKVLRNGLALFDQALAVMLGLEIAGDTVTGSVYGGVRRNRAFQRAIDDAFGFLVAALVPPAREAWRPIAQVLLDAAGEELLYFSFAPVASGGWVKLDTGQRPLGIARKLLDATGHAGAWSQVLAEIERRRIPRWSHVGVRFDDRGVALVFYWSLLDEMV